MRNISATHIQKIYLDSTNDINQAIREATNLLLENGYSNYSDDDNFLFIKSSNGYVDTVNIDLQPYRNHSSDINKSHQNKYNKRGFDENKIHKDTKTKYDCDGFDSSGYDKNYNTREDFLAKRGISETLDSRLNHHIQEQDNSKDVNENNIKKSKSILDNIICHNCRKKIDLDSKFCTYCGTQIAEDNKVNFKKKDFKHFSESDEIDAQESLKKNDTKKVNVSKRFFKELLYPIIGVGTFWLIIITLIYIVANFAPDFRASDAFFQGFKGLINGGTLMSIIVIIGGIIRAIRSLFIK